MMRRPVRCAFSERFAELLAGGGSELELSDVEPAGFRALVEYLRTGKVRLPDKETSDRAREAGEKYGVGALCSAADLFDKLLKGEERRQSGVQESLEMDTEGALEVLMLGSVNS